MGLNLNSDNAMFLSEIFANRSSRMYSGSFKLDTTDYASIKSDSYLKSAIPYPSKNVAEKSLSSTPSTGMGNSTAKSFDVLEAKAEQMKESADSMIVKGTKSLFHKKDITTTAEDGTKTVTNDYDRDTIYKGAKGFVADYNSLIQEASGSSNINILRQTLSLTSYTNAFSGTLASAGISIGKDNTLSIDEESFKESDMSTIKTLFNDANSYAYTVSAKSSQINYYAENEASKASAYKGTYSSGHASGNLFNHY